MKKLLNMVMAVSCVMALSACGGDSDSSGTYTATFTKTLANKNVYSCPSRSALDACTDDNSCKVAKCDLTKKVVTPVDPNTTNNCDVNGKTVSGTYGQSCKFVDPMFDANMTITCSSTTPNTMMLDGKIGNFNASNTTLQSGTNVNTFILKCR